MYRAFTDHWIDTSLYSEIKLKEVPINGVLFPVALFDEHINYRI